MVKLFYFTGVVFYSLMQPGLRLQSERLPIGWVYPQYVSLMDIQSSIQSSIQVHIFDVSLVVYVGLAYLALVVRLMKAIHQGLLLWTANSSCSHGIRWPQMSLRDNRSIFCIPALICSGSSTDD